MMEIPVKDDPKSNENDPSKTTVSPTGTVTFQDLGIPVTQNTRITFLGKVQTCSSLKAIEIVFLLLSVVSFLISVGMTIQRLIQLDKSTDDYTFAILLLLTTSFCLYYAIDGIFLERPYEILVCVVSTFIVIIYCILNYVYGSRDTLKMVRLITALVFGSGVVGAGIYIAYDYQKHGDLIYRTVGANIELQSCCKILFLVSSLLGLDLQLEASMLIFVMRNGTTLSELETIVLSIGVPFAVIWLILGCLSMRLENKTISSIFLVLCIIEPGYIFYKFISLPEEDSKILQYSVIACGISALLVRISLIMAFLFAVRNFGKGLKEKIYRNQLGLPNSRPEQ